MWRSRVAGVGIEDALELWASSLREVKRRIRPLFTQERVAVSAGLFLDGLLGPERRKTGWMRAEAAGDPGPWRQQAILGRGRWQADALRDLVREYALESLADWDAVLVVDETGFLKQGKSSCGVARQYTGSAGKITNCQIGVFAAYVSRHGHAFIDRALYLPKAWTDDPARLAAAHVPPGIGFATKPRLALAMIKRALAAGVPFTWVAADSVYGVGQVETALRRAGKGYVLGVTSSHPFNAWGDKPLVAGTAEEIAQALPVSAWIRLSTGEGSKGPRLQDWAYLELADLDAADYDSSLPGLWTRGLLVRRSLADGELAFFSTWCPTGTGIETLVKVEGQRWAIEDGFETAKNELGLDHNETRSWHGWHRHVSLVMLAFAMLAVIRHHANAPTPPKIPIRLARKQQTSSAGRSRSSATSPSALPSGASSPPTSSPGPSGDAPTRPLHDART
ncbi:MAG TPA: IS701 family transposase [Myxococcota bacterium]|nr:IS701 family transposase [Myxococcota bacterium]